jgi:hypothetical protein
VDLQDVDAQQKGLYSYLHSVHEYVLFFSGWEWTVGSEQWIVNAQQKRLYFYLHSVHEYVLFSSGWEWSMGSEQWISQMSMLSRRGRSDCSSQHTPSQHTTAPGMAHGEKYRIYLKSRSRSPRILNF